MKKIFLKILIYLLLFFSFFAFAQAPNEQLSLTITPPLIKVNLSPDQIWQSSIKIVNNNPQDLNVFVTAMDFKSGKEGGVVFVRGKEETDKKFLLSQWIEIPTESILIPAFQSKQIPFSISVPSDAEPGGKYAAILVGTKPPESEGTIIKITPLVSSLILATIKGEVKEEIWIREFSTNKTFFQKPQVQFNLKIENIGNVHIQPQGEIKILNMFGKERGIIPINQKTEYGNILPQSSRKWTFSWQRENNLFEAGRYKAILTLIYGNETKQTVVRELHFWIIPLVPVLAILGGILVLFGLMILIIRIYVKKAISTTLSLAQKEKLISPEIIKKEKPILMEKSSKKISDIIKIPQKSKLEVPKESKAESKKPLFLSKKIIFLLILILLLIILGFFLYFKNAPKEDENYQISTQEQGEVSPHQLIEEIKEKTENISEMPPDEEIKKDSFGISILNGSGIKGLAKDLEQRLQKEGFKIEKVGNAENFNFKETLIKYKKDKEREARFLNQFFNNKFKLIETENQEEDIILIIGQDFVL